ncbi:MAG: hypothetical protein BWY67_01064 [Bacteroidetes bacterium ADurb.Bin397]|nr:MAG: hypothetical protein BWY67_01064 [Bacteroidetes bacterium ADurb.Bin397]
MFDKKKQEKPDLKKIYEAHKDEILSLVRMDLPKLEADEWFKNMTMKYVDGKGKKYYEFTAGTLQPPLERTAKAMDIMMMMSKGLSGEETLNMVDAISEQLALAFAGKKNNAFVNIGALLKAMTDRVNMPFHIGLMYEFIAVWKVREDELPHVFSQEIHEQKVKQFKEDNRGKNSFFFFQVPELRMVNEHLGSTEAEWMQLCNESDRKIKALTEWIKTLSTGAKQSQSTRKTEKPM